ncbi:pentatricopeptide repeat-containing protein At1g11290, chloroplastic-like [Selaginella moellendorffii]|uniref:pentatricopeptide repeat-containing protein At1g11290, chloroplastic-like n=1 Tax=Selaginella moellendorffii TaxID=88036 RepID=UPI000D1CC636|nr:pentatricopeptide repeat-containing protein At1g11290, chloroplastic-like [Selaginella moellendorffii]|eukprot:XP_024520361.1 pentatricopeptide repeat-containing protein At1g11290, chloroplastic-like [Selaginella moellendorffii]
MADSCSSSPAIPSLDLSPSEQETAAIVAALKSCGRSRDLHRGRAIHARLLQQRDRQSSKAALILANSLIDMYAKSGSMADARDVFEAIKIHSIVSWNTIIGGYASNGQGEIALEMFSAMPSMNARSCVAVLEAIKDLTAREAGMKIEIQGRALVIKIVSLERTMALHSWIVDAGFESNVFIANSLIDCYSRCGSMPDSQRLFDRLLLYNLADLVSWNSIILGYVHNDQPRFALELFDRMIKRESSISPSARTFVAVINACSSLVKKNSADRELRSWCLARAAQITTTPEVDNDEFLQNSLLDLYVKSGELERARAIFQRMQRHTLVSWNVMTLGIAEAGASPKLAIELLDQMRARGFTPDAGTFIAAIKACSNSGFLEPGKSVVHSLVCRAGVEAESAVACSLIGHYGRCGCPVAAELAFHAFSSPDMAPWSALIAAHSHCVGSEEHAFRFFRQMLQESIRPDEITLLSLLSACSRLGLVERAKNLFRVMSVQHGIAPRMEHYTCLVDLLSRANQVEEAIAVIERMPGNLTPSLAIWMAVLSACHNRKNVAIGRRAFDAIRELSLGSEEDGTLAAAYTLMANIYSNRGIPPTEIRVLPRSYDSSS